jgi:hypothetical protein
MKTFSVVLCLFVICLMLVHNKKKAPYALAKLANYPLYYDAVTYDQSKLDYELATVRETKPTSVLHVGCGLGHFTNFIGGTGLDTPEFVAAAKKKYPASTFVAGSPLDKDLFAPASFSTVACFAPNLYYIQHKEVFFQNAAYWLQSGGILVLEVCDAVQLGRNCSVNFNYKVTQVGKHHYESVRHLGRIRKNKHTFYLESADTVEQIATSIGFKVLKRTQRSGQQLWVLQYF